MRHAPSRGSRADLVTDTPGSPPADAAIAALETAVRDLQREVDNLRNALRYRGIIEQAKGVLTAVTGEPPEQAFRRLVTRSQHTNRKVTEVAAGLIAQAVAADATTRPDGAHLFEDPGPGVVGATLTRAALASVRGEALDLAHALLRELEDLEVCTVALTAVDTDGSLLLLAYEGAERQAAEGWGHIPRDADVPLAEAARTGRMILLRDRVHRIERFPGSRHVVTSFEATASIPLTLGHRCVGVLGLVWPTPNDFPPETITRLEVLAAELAPRIAAYARSRDGLPMSEPAAEAGYDVAFRSLLHLIASPVALLEAVFDGGEVVDLRVEAANASARADGVEPDRGLVHQHPEVVVGGLLGRAGWVLRSGQHSVPAPSDTCDGDHLRITRARLAPVGSLLLATWDHTPTVPAWPA
jgi:hypothetical protein